jgi:hypothetical protein
MEILFYLLNGALFGAVPMIVGNKKKQKDLGRVGFIFCTLGGLLFPIVLSLVLAILFTWRIYAIDKIKKSKSS